MHIKGKEMPEDGFGVVRWLDMKAQKKLTHILFPDIFHKIRFACRKIEMTATDLLFTLPFNKAKSNSFQVLFS